MTYLKHFFLHSHWRMRKEKNPAHPTFVVKESDGLEQAYTRTLWGKLAQNTLNVNSAATKFKGKKRVFLFTFLSNCLVNFGFSSDPPAILLTPSISHRSNASYTSSHKTTSARASHSTNHAQQLLYLVLTVITVILTITAMLNNIHTDCYWFEGINGQTAPC